MWLGLGIAGLLLGGGGWASDRLVVYDGLLDYRPSSGLRRRSRLTSSVPELRVVDRLRSRRSAALSRPRSRCPPRTSAAMTLTSSPTGSTGSRMFELDGDDYVAA